MVNIPGGTGANKGFWRTQLRDRNGRFVEMGGEVLFEIQLPGVSGTSHATGYFIGMADLETARIEVRDNSKISAGVYLVEPKDLTGITAILPEEYVKKKTQGGPKEADVPELKQEITGSDALKTRLKSVTTALKKEGRFPIPRLGLLQELGKDTDTVKGAKIDYKKVFDAEPGLQERFKDFDSMWQYVYDNSAGTTTQSPNDLDDIDPEVKMLNRAYAEHILGLKPDGMITVYRNAVNGKDTESESAVGYVSLDKNFAYDYASHRDSVAKNGRYEIDVKPDEFQGMLGYSQAEDEYALTIGRGVTEQEGRVRRVGDLAVFDLEASWLKDWGRETFNRGQGGTPYRHFSVAGTFDFHEVEPLGDTLTDFLAKYDLEASAIKSKFEQLHGEGSYEDYKNSGNTLSFANIKSLFVELDNGKIGLDAAKIFSSETVGENATYKNDRFDNTMKMLSTLQELSGEPFMTHKSRDYRPGGDSTDQVSEPTEAGTADIVGSGIENWLPIMADILKSTEDSESEDNNFDPELGNKRLSTVMEMAGYNSKPRVVSTEEFDSIEGKTLYRGVNDEKFIDQYKNSPKHFAGQGNFGNGTYSTDSKATSTRYGGSSENNILEFKLSSDANIQRFNSRRELFDWTEETLAGIREKYSNSGVSNDEYYEFIRQMDNTADWTNLAVMLGIDAIEFPPSSALEERYTIILNRGKVIINDKS